MCGRLHAALADERRGPRGSHDPRPGPPRFRGLRNRQNPGGEHDVTLQLRRQRTDVIDTGDGQDDVDLLHADLDVAFRHQFGHGNAVDELDLVLDLVGDAQPLHQVRDIDAARAGARIGDRFGGEHRALEGVGAADVGLGRSGFTATPSPARAKSTRSPTTLPCLIRLSITSGVWVTRSAGALELIFCSIALPSSKLTMTLWPLARSKAGARSRTADTTPKLVKTTISAARAGACVITPSTPSKPAVAAFKHLVIVSSTGRPNAPSSQGATPLKQRTVMRCSCDVTGRAAAAFSRWVA